MQSRFNLDPENKGDYSINHFHIKEHYSGLPILKNVFLKIHDIILNIKPHHNPKDGDMGADYPAWNYHMNIAGGKMDKHFVIRYLIIYQL